MTAQDLVEVAMHNTRLFPRFKGVAKYRLGGIAARCDWVALTDNTLHSDGILRGEGLLLRNGVSPHTVFLSMRSSFHALPWFYEEVLPKISQRFILISGSEDFTIPNQVDKRLRPATAAEKDLVRTIASDNRLIHWFAENRDQCLPNMSTLPVGYVFKDGASELVSLAAPAVALADRPLKVFCAHRVRAGEQWDERRRLTGLCRRQFAAFTTVCEEEVSEREFERQLQRHPFVLCASGGGLDPSPKVWRSIASGCIPVIKSSVLDDAYKQLPVAMVKQWSEDCLSEGQLRSWLDKLAPYYEAGPLRTEVLHKLSLDYWWKQILRGRAY